MTPKGWCWVSVVGRLGWVEWVSWLRWYAFRHFHVQPNCSVVVEVVLCCRRGCDNKRWTLYLKSWQSYECFQESSQGEISISSNFQSLKSHAGLKFYQIFVCGPFLYMATCGTRHFLHEYPSRHSFFLKYYTLLGLTPFIIGKTDEVLPSGQSPIAAGWIFKE